jgi:hypothetical protein
MILWIVFGVEVAFRIQIQLSCTCDLQNNRNLFSKAHVGSMPSFFPF